MSETNVERARRGYAAVLRGDLEPIAAMLDPDVRWHGGDPTAEGACRNRGQVLDVLRRAGELRPLPELVDVVDAGDRVVVVLRRAVDPPELVANVSTFRDGRVVEMVHHADVDEALRACGVEWSA